MICFRPRLEGRSPLPRRLIPTVLVRKRGWGGGAPYTSTTASNSSSALSSSVESDSVNWLSYQDQTKFPISVCTADNPSMAQALRNRQRWLIPADKEMMMLADMDLYDEISFKDIPPGVHILPTKMDFKMKYDSFGVFLKDKAALVLLGNLEWETLQHYISGLKRSPCALFDSLSSHLL